MKQLIFSDQNLTINVRFTVDMFDASSSEITVMDISGLDEAEKALGLDFRQLPYNMNDFTAFATANDLKLTLTDTDSVTPTVLVGHTGMYYAGGLGVDNI